MRIELQTTLKSEDSRWGAMKAHLCNSVNAFFNKVRKREGRKFSQYDSFERHKKREDFQQRKREAIREHNEGRVFFFIDNQVNW